jgi:hypothetical protein
MVVGVVEAPEVHLVTGNKTFMQIDCLIRLATMIQPTTSKATLTKVNRVKENGTFQRTCLRLLLTLITIKILTQVRKTCLQNKTYMEVQMMISTEFLLIKEVRPTESLPLLLRLKLSTLLKMKRSGYLPKNSLLFYLNGQRLLTPIPIMNLIRTELMQALTAAS